MIFSSVAEDHERLVAALERSAEWAAEPDLFRARSEDVSGWSVGMHLEHLLRSNRGIVTWLGRVAAGEDADRRRDRNGPTLAGWLVLLTGHIPRGGGRAPDATVPEGIEREEVLTGLRQVLGAARRLGGGLEALDGADPRMNHPVLGALSASQWLRFGRIHHEHHEKIIRDIL